MTGLEMTAVFHGVDEKMFRWEVTLRFEGREFKTTYSMGLAHCKRTERLSARHRVTIASVPGLARALKPFGTLTISDTEGFVTPNEPALSDVLESLRLDASVPLLFEDFCSDFGYDTDSRKAEKLHRACIRVKGELEKLFGMHFDAFMQAGDEVQDSEGQP